MDGRDAAMATAGLIGCAVAVVHGLLTQRHMVEPFERLAAPGLSGSVRRLVRALLQFSAFNWFVGGLALIIAALWLGAETRLAVGLLVGSSYLFGVVGNAWATRGRHPGWMLYAVAVGLIGYAIAA
jgi:hypothetical protein